MTQATARANTLVDTNPYRSDPVMSFVRDAARSGEPNTELSASSNPVTSPTRLYANFTGNGYPVYLQPAQQQSQTSSPDLYVPIQPEQFVGECQDPPTQNRGADRIGGGLGGSGSSYLALYPGGVNVPGKRTEG